MTARSRRQHARLPGVPPCRGRAATVGSSACASCGWARRRLLELGGNLGPDDPDPYRWHGTAVHGVASRIPVDGSAHVTGTKSTHCVSRPDLRLGKWENSLHPYGTVHCVRASPVLYRLYTPRTATRCDVCAVLQSLSSRVWVAIRRVSSTILRAKANTSATLSHSSQESVGSPSTQAVQSAVDCAHGDRRALLWSTHPCPRPGAVPRPHTMALESARAECSAARQALPPVAMSRHAPFKAQSSFKWYSRPAPSPSAHHCTLPIEEPFLTATWRPPC
jgi:hypothetical protein